VAVSRHGSLLSPRSSVKIPPNLKKLAGSLQNMIGGRRVSPEDVVDDGPKYQTGTLVVEVSDTGAGMSLDLQVTPCPGLIYGPCRPHVQALI
jgi:hypothetical protein